MKKLGLLGKSIGYSFSRNYFSDKFKNEGLANIFIYENYEIDSIEKFSDIFKSNPDLVGLNVTIPYKEAVIPFLDELSENARQIGAVNTIKITPEGKLIGYNTDYFGFLQSLKPLLKKHHTKALLLGTGGAAKAVAYGLNEIGIDSKFVSRQSGENCITYDELTNEVFQECQIIINCTPLGTFPKIELFPDIPYHFLTQNHIAFDLIYNPEKTEFLKKAENKGAVIKNGYEMLVFQAEKAWKIWNN
ncbi:shikimate dehydrogenase family protein [Flavobacterium sp.]|uniref:shikimate dehydrogenase family protein n=1 Tax=Flavobacterium sp. TaxID=239 RepID=UPI003D6AD1E4